MLCIPGLSVVLDEPEMDKLLFLLNKKWSPFTRGFFIERPSA